MDEAHWPFEAMMQGLLFAPFECPDPSIQEAFRDTLVPWAILLGTPYFML